MFLEHTALWNYLSFLTEPENREMLAYHKILMHGGLWIVTDKLCVGQTRQGGGDCGKVEPHLSKGGMH